jgi:hypothetical protein
MQTAGLCLFIDSLNYAEKERVCISRLGCRIAAVSGLERTSLPSDGLFSRFRVIALPGTNRSQQETERSLELYFRDRYCLIERVRLVMPVIRAPTGWPACVVVSTQLPRHLSYSVKQRGKVYNVFILFRLCVIPKLILTLNRSSFGFRVASR